MMEGLGIAQMFWGHRVVTPQSGYIYVNEWVKGAMMLTKARRWWTDPLEAFVKDGTIFEDRVNNTFYMSEESFRKLMVAAKQTTPQREMRRHY